MGSLKTIPNTGDVSAWQEDHRDCPRCRGLLVYEQFMDVEQSGFLWSTGWRCVNCGNIVFTLAPGKPGVIRLVSATGARVSVTLAKRAAA